MPESSSLVMRRRSWAGRLAACLALLVAAGCTPDYKARGIVKGKVTTRGGTKALTSGTVMFYGKNGMTASAAIGTDGTYEMPDAPLGECRVTVTVPNLPPDPTVRARLQGKGPAMPAGPKDPNAPPESSSPAPPLAKIPKEIVPIDAKYSDPDNSGLSFTVKKGEQTYNIDL